MPVIYSTGPPELDAAKGHCPVSIGLLLTAKGCPLSGKGKFTFPWKAQRPRERSDALWGFVWLFFVKAHMWAYFDLAHICMCFWVDENAVQLDPE